MTAIVIVCIVVDAPVTLACLYQVRQNFTYTCTAMSIKLASADEGKTVYTSNDNVG